MLRTASDLYALSQGKCNEGKEECHWCGGACGRQWIHDDDPPIPFQRTTLIAKRPGNAWMCNGCRHFREPRQTVLFLSGGFADRKCPADYSWLLTPEGVRVVEYDLLRLIYPTLLAPPKCFALSLQGEMKCKCLIQLAILNQHEEVKADTPLHYTIDNIAHTYTVYELEEGLVHGEEGKMPGVRALLRLLGPYSLEGKKRSEGRFATSAEVKKKGRKVS